MVGVASILLGGRLLHLLAVHDTIIQPIDFIAFWQPGFSILGSIIGLLICVPLYLIWCKIPVLSFFDLIATYAGLLQGISRIGCFFAGCCFGTITTCLWGIIYNDPDSSAPLHMILHPVQLYSAILLLLIFIFMYTVARRTLPIAGQQTALYLMLCSLERFITDFWRGDRDFFNGLTISLSIHQTIALAIFISACILMGCVTIVGKKHQYEHI
jgi:phosphatidylglycerol:prolipoprotein diacylglycerol transferase